MDLYIGIAVIALVLFAGYKIYEYQKERKARNDAPPMSDPLPPDEVTRKKSK